MQSVLRDLQSRLRYKIILPFLVLTLAVALIGGAFVFALQTGYQQADLDNQVVNITRTTNDGIVEQEINNVSFLRRIVFAPANPDTRAPAVADAIAKRNRSGLANALEPFFRAGVADSGVSLDRLIAFDTAGRTLVDMEQDPLAASSAFTTTSRILDFSSINTVRRVLNAEEDALGDKFAGVMLIQLPTSDDTSAAYFATVTPVYKEDQVVGGIILATRLSNLLEKLARRAGAEIIIMYDRNGEALALFRASVPEQTQLANQFTETDFLDDEDELAMQLIDLTTLQLNPPTLEQLQQAATVGNEEAAVLDTIDVDRRAYQLAFTPLEIRQAQQGYLGAGLPRDMVENQLSRMQYPIIAVVALLMIGIVWVGNFVATRITAPLEELVRTAESVTAGNIHRRSRVRTHDEIGQLSRSFNTMTSRLVKLYANVLKQSSQRAAIVESIADSIVVCDTQGNIELINPAARALLNLGPEDAPPARFSDIDLAPLPEGEGAFGLDDASDMQTLGNRIVRVSQAPIDVEGDYLGQVYVMHDMTREIEMIRAKNNFINTIGHELRTPITILRGTADLLTRGMFGRLEDRQSEEVGTMQKQLLNLTNVINNIIMIADLDSGSLDFELEPLVLQETVDEAVWKLRSSIQEKGLTITTSIPDDLPLVLADFILLPTILQQLLDNAQRYTSEGGITIRAARKGKFVQVDVCDTGPGIAPDMHDQVFERFVRIGGADTQVRGIGLGLAIVKQLVQRHGGQVWVTSAAGGGSIFSFTLRQADVVGHPEEKDRAFGTAA